MTFNPNLNKNFTGNVLSSMNSRAQEEGIVTQATSAPSTGDSSGSGDTGASSSEKTEVKTTITNFFIQ